MHPAMNTNVELSTPAELIVSATRALAAAAEAWKQVLILDPAQEDARKFFTGLGKLDAGSLKIKLASSIVAISSIHLLKIFMNAEKTDNDKLMWFTIIHMTFVVSAVAMGYLDRLTRQTLLRQRRRRRRSLT